MFRVREVQRIGLVRSQRANREKKGTLTGKEKEFPKKRPPKSGER